jgi:hypothetical protein
MHIALRRLLGLADDTAAPRPLELLWSLGPLFAPLIIVLIPFRAGGIVAVQGEFILAALAWIGLTIPGMLATNLLFARAHPLGRGVSRLAIATVLALVPFALPAWAGCLLHWRLGRALWIYAALYVLMVAGLGLRLVRRGPAQPEPNDESASVAVAVRPWPRWVAAVVIAMIGLIMVGVAMSSPPQDRNKRFVPAARPGWWHGTALGGAASVIAGVLVLLASRGPRAGEVEQIAPACAAPGDARRRKRSKDDASEPPAWTRSIEMVLTGVLWSFAALLVLFVMRVSYSDSAPEKSLGVLTWNVDDVAYVTEAVDYQYGQPMGLYEPSLGSDHGLQRSGLSPLTAPLVAAIARFTGVSCPALHHAVLPPLMILLGASALAAALMVVSRQHRWLVPMGMIVCFLVINKTWDYERCFTETVVYRALQTKGIHLLLVYPIQLAAAVLLLVRPNGRHLLLAILTALIGYLVHPLAAIQGVIWGGTLLVAAALWWRKAMLPTAGVLAAYLALCGSYYLESWRPMTKAPPASGRQEGSPIQSRDLVRVDAPLFRAPAKLSESLDTSAPSPAIREAFAEHKIALRPDALVMVEEGVANSWLIEERGASYRLRVAGDELAVFQVAAKPVVRLDPFWAFGCDTLNHAGTLAIPVLLAFGWRRREWLIVALLGAATLVVTNFEPIGRMLSVALPESIFWRAKWFTPALVNLAGLAAVLYFAVGALWSGVEVRWSDARGFALTIPAIIGFPIMLANTSSARLKIDEPPKMLTKFSPDMHALVTVLGGTEASPFVFGTFLVQHELPQLMPNIKLVFSRDKIMRVADDPDYRQIAIGVQQGINTGRLDERLFDRLCALYPIDHVVIDHRGRRGRDGKVQDLAEQPASVLAKRGWKSVGRAGVYEAWKRPSP